MADAKRAAREIEGLDKYHERLWRREDELVPQFILIRPRVVAGEPVKYESQVPYAIVKTYESKMVPTYGDQPFETNFSLTLMC